MKKKEITINDFSVKTSKSTSRKYPNVMWFPRSKTDPQEIREVLKLALKVQDDNPDNFFNDRLLGEYMARTGSINVVGMQGEEYVEAYQGKSIGDVSYITNARMLMRVFRFLGLVTRVSKSKYQLTELGLKYAQFSGDFPAQIDGTDEESMLLNSLANFAFYSINDDSAYRDISFQVRPFISLLNNLAIEPQCIYQLIVTAFAAKRENADEIKRVRDILERLRAGKTTLESEFEYLGLDANDYSCVHNFYDSAKILVYIGTSLGLIDKTSNPSYGKKIAGKARNLKQASIFYRLTEKGAKYLDEKIKNRLIFYSDVHHVLGDKSVLQGSFILAALNEVIGSRKVESIHSDLFQKILGEEWREHLSSVTEKLQIETNEIDGFIKLNTGISFNFYQSVPPEFLHLDPFKSWYTQFLEEFKKENSELIKVSITKLEEQFTGEVVSKFKLTEEKIYKIPDMSFEETQSYIKYSNGEGIFGGQDRFANRISPTNSVLLVGDRVHVDNEKDALDLLVPLRFPDNSLRQFIDENIIQLVQHFLSASDVWTKDQHYTWVRNCFRQFGAEAIYSGSGGMLSRADVSVVNPFIGGIEAKSPSENRGSINTKAIRQAIDAKVQVGHKFPDKRTIPRVAIAVGRRITTLAIEEEKKWKAEGQPVLLISDLVLYYLTLKTLDIEFSKEDVVELFTSNSGVFDSNMLQNSLEKVMSKRGTQTTIRSKIKDEINNLQGLVRGSSVGAVE